MGGASLSVLLGMERQLRSIQEQINAVHMETVTPRILLPGYMPGVGLTTKLVLAQDVDWPPYAYFATPPEGAYTVAGFGNDVAKGLTTVCPHLEVTTVQTKWSDCWSNGAIGEGLLGAHYHACMTYTHTVGERNRFMEFSRAILQANKPAGLLTRLLADGTPVISPRSNLTGVRVVDVKGWAPTQDGLALVDNACTGERFQGFEMVEPPGDGNDVAMQMLLSGEVDAMWVYADQAFNYQPTPGIDASWNVTLWEGFGTKYAYIHTGMYDHAYNGTTLTMAPLGSGVASIVNPCIDQFLRTAEYERVCAKHSSLYHSCYQNAHFPAADDSSTPKPWELGTAQQPGPCSTGYCSCSA